MVELPPSVVKLILSLQKNALNKRYRKHAMKVVSVLLMLKSAHNYLQKKLKPMHKLKLLALLRKQKLKQSNKCLVQEMHCVQKLQHLLLKALSKFCVVK